MVALNETTIGLAFAVFGVVATIIWYGLALYGIRTLQDIRDALGNDNHTNSS